MQTRRLRNQRTGHGWGVVLGNGVGKKPNGPLKVGTGELSAVEGSESFMESPAVNAIAEHVPHQHFKPGSVVAVD